MKYTYWYCEIVAHFYHKAWRFWVIYRTKKLQFRKLLEFNIGKHIAFCFTLIFGVKIWCFRKQFLSSIRDWKVIFFYKCKSKVGSRKCMSWAFQILSYFHMLKSKWPHNLWLKIRTGFLNTRFWPPKTTKRKKLHFFQK